MRHVARIVALSLAAVIYAALVPFQGAVLAAPSTQQSCNGSDGVYLYAEDSYDGRCVRLTSDVADLSSVGFNNVVSSLQIRGDFSVTLYVNQNYDGASSTFTRDDPDLSDNGIGDNRASSARIDSNDDGDLPRENRCEDDDESGVFLYEDRNYGGRCLRLTSDEIDLSNFGFNNTISSVRVRGGYSATLFIDQNYTGASSSLTANDPDLSNDTVGENRASSVRVRRDSTPAPAGFNCDGSEGVYLYADPNYQGRCIKLTADLGDFRSVSFDDSASSLRVLGSYSVALFRDLNGEGASSSFSGDDANLADNPIGDNQATSARVQRGAAPPPASGNCDGSPGVYLYADPNYQGRCVKLTSDAPDLRSVDLNDTASSLRILGNYSVVLFRDLNGTGLASGFNRDDPNLADDPIGDNQATSAQVRQGGGTPISANCDGSEGVYLYEHPNYQGRCVKLTGDTPDLRTLGFDDSASSMRLVGRWTVVLYRDLSNTGLASGFNRDDPNLADDPIGDNQTTSVQARRS